MFDEFDKVVKLDVFLYDLKFGIAIANLEKTFNKFLARFISAIALLDFTDQHKILNL